MRLFSPLFVLLLALVLPSCGDTYNYYYYDTEANEGGDGSSSAGNSGGSDNGNDDDGSGSATGGDDDTGNYGDDDDGNTFYGDGYDDYDDTDGGDTKYGDEDDGEDDYHTTVDGVLDVSTALRQNYGSIVNVEGYIVGSSPSGVAKTVFEKPFTSTNLVLCDRKYEGVAIGKDELMQVKLTDSGVSTLRSQFNLSDHPELQNRKVQVSAEVSTYYKRVALVKVQSIQLLD